MSRAFWFWPQQPRPRSGNLISELIFHWILPGAIEFWGSAWLFPLRTHWSLGHLCLRVSWIPLTFSWIWQEVRLLSWQLRSSAFFPTRRVFSEAHLLSFWVRSILSLWFDTFYPTSLSPPFWIWSAPRTCLRFLEIIFCSSLARHLLLTCFYSRLWFRSGWSLVFCYP